MHSAAATHAPLEHRACCSKAAIDCTVMNAYVPSIFGFLLGFGFGVGCALAVMYSIYLGGYRAALRDSRLPTPPERYRKALEKLSSTPKP